MEVGPLSNHELLRIADGLVEELAPLRFALPVTCVYNPLEYARESFSRYVELYGASPREIVLVGMNPGPWGMAQTGVPFGEVAAVRDWLGICAPVRRPAVEHPQRPVMGFDCHRSEVSGARLWGWARERFERPDAFFARHFVLNYCPLVFMEASGKNRTPDQLPAAERAPLFEICDRALRRSIEHLSPTWALGVGRFAEGRLRVALKGLDVRVGTVPHPSPASPQANRGWAAAMEESLQRLGLL